MRLDLLAFASLLLASPGHAAQPDGSQKSTAAYRLSGDRTLRPSLINDDGAKMYLTWPPDAELPAIFALDIGNREVMVDAWMRGGRLVIDRIHPRLIFRLDRQVARADRLTGRR